MKAEKANYPVAMMARLLRVSRSGFYSWLKRFKPKDPWSDLRVKIEKLWLDSDRVFGVRQIHSKLSAKGDDVTLYRVGKCMKAMGIAGCQPRSSKKTTIPDPSAEKRPDLIGRNFDSPVPTTCLVGDITYLKTGQGWLYLAVVIDLCTRMVVGWAMADHMKTSLVVSALSMAHTRGYVARNGIFHSDMGSQYTSHEFARFADSIDVRLSVGKKATCYDNAVAESWFASLKNEKYYRYSYSTKDEAKVAIIDYIEAFYNRMRPHSSIGNQIPAEKMESFQDRMAEDAIRELKLNEEPMKLLAA
jgi:transposase InsO family protein